MSRRAPPAWTSWVGTQPALELLNRLGIEFVYEHDVALASRLRASPGMPLRASSHVTNAADEIDAALDALTG